MTPQSEPARAPRADPVVVAVDLGEIDLLTAPAFHRLLTSTKQTAPCVIADMSGVDFMDSTGLRTLLITQRELDQEGGGLVLARCTPAVRAVLRRTLLDTIIPCRPSISEARRELPC